MNEFAFIDFKKPESTVVFFYNCHTGLCQGQISKYFNVVRPEWEKN